MTASRADDPFDGLPILIPVPQAAKPQAIANAFTITRSIFASAKI